MARLKKLASKINCCSWYEDERPIPCPPCPSGHRTMLWKAQGIFADQPMLLELDAPMQAWLHEADIGFFGLMASLFQHGQC